MASDINVVTITGRLTKPAEIKYTKSGIAVCSFSIASNTSQRMQDGSWGDYANFFDCTWFGKGAEVLNPYLSKGRMVVVSGELRQRRWEDHNGASRSAVGINVQNLTLGGDGKPKDGQQAQPQSQQRTSRQAPNSAVDTYTAAGPEEFDDENIPF